MGGEVFIKMTKKQPGTDILDIVNKWKEGGYMLDPNTMVMNVSYHVTEERGRWPIWLVDRKGWPCKTKQDEFEHVVAEFVDRFGLDQTTLWDTYSDHVRDISVSRRRRDD